MHKTHLTRTVSLLAVLALMLALFSGLSQSASAAGDEIWREQPTGYTKASDVSYVKVGNYVANWGVRGEAATFLTSYAENYYTGNYTYEKLSGNQGNANTASTPSSTLYKALQSMLKAKQTSTTSYAGTRDLYKYTDCMVSQYSNISSFYSGRLLKGEWDSGKTWNREHTWPNSKISGNGENDIMMLRPTSVKENSDRGNKAYGESSGCYDPNVEATPNGFNVRGDCARIILYVYVRWGETSEVLSNMWGTSGVMESLDILLKWMEEDPVDTWELGRNDAVQSITGVRNVFVDYPELAWLLFNQTVPAGYPTPSSGAAPAHEHDYQAVVTDPTCTEQGYTTYTCSTCGDSYVDNYTDALGHNWGAPEYVWRDDLAEVTATRVCSRDASHIETETVQTSFEITKEATVEEEGEITYTAVFENAAFQTQTQAVSTPKLDPVPQPVTFDDVPADAYYAESVAWAVENGVTNGTGDNKFSPNRDCTRGQVVTFLWRAQGSPEPESAENPFTDVKDTDYFFKAVLWAKENGITTGTSATTFSPEKPCTRGQVVTFLWRTAGQPDPEGSHDLPIIPSESALRKADFGDVSDDAYYYDAVCWAVNEGITNGTSDTTFSPDRTCTRGHVVTFLYRYKN